MKYFVIIIIFAAASFAGCSKIDLVVKEQFEVSKSFKILIGAFATRDMNYDPFLSSELRESIRFEFFKNGFNAEVWYRDPSDTKLYDKPSAVAALCSETGADILITGIISRKEAGSFADRRIYFSVTFLIRDKNGNVIGEGVYCDSDIDAPVFVRDAAASFAGQCISRMKLK